MKNKTLNILMGIDSYYPIVDGVTECMHNYLKELNKTNTAFALAPKLDKNYIDNFPYEVYRCKSVYIPIYNNRYPTPSIDKKLKRELSERQIDIIHLHSPFSICKYATTLAKEKCVPIVSTFHTKFRQEFQNRLKNEKLTNHFMHKIGKALNQMNEVFVANDSMINELRSYGYYGKVTQMPLGTEFAPNSNSEELNEIANSKFALNNDEIIFLFVGRIEKVKNLDFTLDALAQLKKHTNNFKFIIVGTGSEIDNLKAKVRQNLLTKNVIFTGFIDREILPALYSRANLLLFPSSFDTFGLIKVEASAFNTPTLTLENTCVSYGITDGENGFLIKDSVEDYANKLKEIIEDKNTLAKVGKQAGATLYCSWQTASEKLLQRYKELIEENKLKYECRKSGKLNEY
ncbi:MAG: glycosyltransferase [Christensenellales bacterium]